VVYSNKVIKLCKDKRSDEAIYEKNDETVYRKSDETTYEKKW